MTSTIPYSDFKDQVRAIVFPDGEAENLQTTHDAYIQDALINLQTFVPCLKSNHVDFYDKEDCREWCGLDFVYVPRGVIHAVYAFNPTSRRCRKYFFDPKSTPYVDEWIKQQRCTTCSEQTTPDSPLRSPDCDTISTADTYCDEVSDAENDSSFKTTRKYYAVGPDNKLYIMPRFPCGYKIAVHWEGIKRRWNDNDPVPDGMDLINAVSKYVMAQRALYLDGDMGRYDRIMAPKLGEFAIGRADMIYRCTRERRIQERHQSINSFDVLQPFFYDPLPEPDDEFAVIGDWGFAATPDGMVAVDAQVSTWEPDFMVTVGDNRYAAAMEDVVSLCPFYSSLIGSEQFFPAIGNHDLDDGGGLANFLLTFDYITYTTYRNYSVRKNHIEFFFMETHDTGTAPPSLTQQANWLASALQASTAPFKVVITQDPPYTSDADVTDYPGHTPSRLDYAGLGADLVLSGDSHFYERLEVNDFPYIVTGHGGATLNTFNTIPVTGSLVRYNTTYGGLRCKCSATRLHIRMINTNGVEIDSLILSK